VAKAKGKVIIDENKCKGCELCTTACPVKIVALDTNRINAKGYHPVAITDMDKCIGCANCATMCPDGVLTIEREME
jgi:2-oxoglutarate ferredoxin oxidoreductase subunit delta